MVAAASRAGVEKGKTGRKGRSNGDGKAIGGVDPAMMEQPSCPVSLLLLVPAKLLLQFGGNPLQSR